MNLAILMENIEIIKLTLKYRKKNILYSTKQIVLSKAFFSKNT